MFRILFPLLSVLALCAACAACAERAASGPPEIPIKTALKLVLLGTGEDCKDDRSCGRPPAAGVCLFGSCYGLLSTDSPAGREVLAERLAASSPELRAAAEQALLRGLRHPEARERTRLAAIVGLGYLLGARVHARCGATCKELRELAGSVQTDLAVAARQALSQRADPEVFDELVTDLRRGSPHLACAAARALGRYRHGDLARLARAVLSRAVRTDDGAVRYAVARALQL